MVVATALTMLVAAGCARAASVTPQQTPGAPTSALPATLAPAPVPTSAPLTAPTLAAPSPSPSLPVSSPGSVGTTTVQIALIALNKGKVGCGDDVAMVERVIPQTQARLTAALRELLGLKVQTYGAAGLYNALYQSDLRVERVELKDGVAQIDLAGQMKLGGVCDSPRVQAQLGRTATQFASVKSVKVTVNGKPLEGLLSGR